MMRERPGWALMPGGLLGFAAGAFGAAWSDHLHRWWSSAGVACSVVTILLSIIAFIAGFVLEFGD